MARHERDDLGGRPRWPGGARTADVKDGLAGGDVRALTALADRLDELADMAGVMGDADGEAKWRERASRRRLQALALLDR